MTWCGMKERADDIRPYEAGSSPARTVPVAR